MGVLQLRICQGRNLHFQRALRQNTQRREFVYERGKNLLTDKILSEASPLHLHKTHLLTYFSDSLSERDCSTTSVGRISDVNFDAALALVFVSPSGLWRVR